MELLAAAEKIELTDLKAQDNGVNYTLLLRKSTDLEWTQKLIQETLDMTFHKVVNMDTFFADVPSTKQYSFCGMAVLTWRENKVLRFSIVWLRCK